MSALTYRPTSFLVYDRVPKSTGALVATASVILNEAAIRARR